MWVRIEQGKGKKDRMVVLPQSVLEQLRVYYLELRPKNCLYDIKTTLRYTHLADASLAKIKSPLDRM